MSVATAIVTVLTALLFLAAAWVKFTEEEHAMRTRDRLRIAPARYRLIGVAEVAGAVGALVGLAVRPLGIAALIGLVLVAVGACGAQVKLRNPPVRGAQCGAGPDAVGRGARSPDRHGVGFAGGHQGDASLGARKRAYTWASQKTSAVTSTLRRLAPRRTNRALGV